MAPQNRPGADQTAVAPAPRRDGPARPPAASAPAPYNRRVVVTRLGGPEVLEIVREPVPTPATGQVRIHMRAAGMSMNEVLMRRGLYVNPAVRVPPPPFTPGYELCGDIDAVGGGVDPALLGRRAVALLGVGAHADWVLVRASEVVLVPAGAAIDPAEAASLVLNWTTAWQMLYRVAKVRAGRRVLIHGAGGGVGSALLQLSHLAGLEIFATASPRKHEFLRSQGATAIDYRREDFVARVRRSTAGQGVDVAFDGVGGDVALRSYALIRSGGKLVLYGDMGKLRAGTRPTSRGVRAALVRNLMFWRRRWVTFYGIGVHKALHPRRFRHDLERLLQMLAAGTIRPKIGARVPLTCIARAHELVEQASVIGKVVVINDAGP